MTPPDWMRALLAQGVDDDPRAHAVVMRERELAMPPDLRASGKKRELRDTYLAWMLLNDARTGRTGNPWHVLERIRTRENSRAEAKARADQLAEGMSVADVEWCSEAARKLFQFIVREGNRNGKR